MVDSPAGGVGHGAGGPERAPRAVPARSWLGVAFALAIVATAALLFLPFYGGVSVSSNGGQSTETATLLQENSPVVLIVLAVPLLLTLLPLCPPPKSRRIVAVTCLVVLAAFVLVSLLTIGRFYLPALVVSLVSVLPRPGRPKGPPDPAGR
ncbi:hypothetical protein [Paeniglutamicibacter cryotolerans]|uniref:CDP-diglyceride synthetase n=1 Tax=Paeniglutamicibacter cryotolerans TaxID=670079 RepID=A0A839QLI2_9MICC|nr:hypothetical protein [Paeniglutamicibacter cryotolerans]MBB2994042.1 CDP-diglyceride synthetase [Paeniglutamicibacter cryotolerans]